MSPVGVDVVKDGQGAIYPWEKIPATAFLRNWLKVGRGFESPATSFLFDLNWRYDQQLEEDNEAFYGNDSHEFKDALEKVGMITKLGEGWPKGAYDGLGIVFHKDLQGGVKWQINPSTQQLVPDSLQQFEDC